MPISVEQDKTRYMIRLEGEIGLSEAADLKRLLLEGLASGREVHLCLERVGVIDVTFMQLLQAALRETEHSGNALAVSLSEPAEAALRGAGFESCLKTTGWSG